MTQPSPSPPTRRYLAPDRLTRNLLNPAVSALTRMGVSLWGSRVLEVPGRKTGEIRSNPVNLLVVDDDEYLVSPRGATQWVRNVRAAGTASLRVGRRIQEYRFDEVGDAAKPPILRSYLRRWKWEVGQFFEGVGPDSSDEEFLAVASGYPVFRLSPVE